MIAWKLFTIALTAVLFVAAVVQEARADVAAGPPASGGVMDIAAWCSDNQDGRAPGMGGPENPCALMCGTVGSTAAAVTNAAVSLAGNIPGFEIIGCLGDLGFNGAEIYETLTDDSWCADNPVSCAAFVVSSGVCTAQSCFGGGGNPYAYALEAVCTAAPLISATIERVGYYGLCVEYLASEIGMPINASQGCFCDRREFFDPGLFYSYQECVAERPAAQIGTAAANCRSGRQTDWLAAASPRCLDAGADNGDTFYQYDTCRFVTRDDAEGWAALRQYQQDQAALESVLDARAPVCIVYCQNGINRYKAGGCQDVNIDALCADYGGSAASSKED